MTQDNLKWFLSKHDDLCEDYLDENCDPPVFKGTSILLAYRGSHAHGTFVPNSNPNGIDDIDLISVNIPHINCYYGLSEFGSRGTKEIKEGEFDAVCYELRKFVSLLIKGNPNVIGLLWTDDKHIIHKNEIAEILINNRELFSAKHIAHHFIEYAKGQLKKMTSLTQEQISAFERVCDELEYLGVPLDELNKEQPSKILKRYESLSKSRVVEEREFLALIYEYCDFRNKYFKGYLGEKRKSLVKKYGYDVKNAAHTVRLVRMCLEFLKTHRFNVDRANIDAQELIDIKCGQYKLKEINEIVNKLLGSYEEAYSNCSLPMYPQKYIIEGILIDCLRKWHS